MQRMTQNTKTHQLSVRVYSHELDRLRAAANLRGVSFADYVRYLLGCHPATRSEMSLRNVAAKKAPAKRKRPKT